MNLSPELKQIAPAMGVLLRTVIEVLIKVGYDREHFLSLMGRAWDAFQKGDEYDDEEAQDDSQEL